MSNLATTPISLLSCSTAYQNSPRKYDKAGEPKEIMWVDALNHIDLYDVEKYVEPAINKTVEWFNKYLRGKSRLNEELTT